jgi:hypothetical protein
MQSENTNNAFEHTVRLGGHVINPPPHPPPQAALSTTLLISEEKAKHFAFHIIKVRKGNRYTALTWPLDRGEWSVSRPGRFTCGEEPQ